MTANCCKSAFQRGYDKAFADMYRVSGIGDNAERCGECRACGVVTTVIEDLVQQLAGAMTEQEFFVFTGIFENVRERRETERAAKRNKPQR